MLLLIDPSLFDAYGLRIGSGQTLRRRFRADWSDIPVLRSAFLANWSRTGVAINERATWDIARTRRWRHQTGWTFRFAYRFRPVYGLRIEAANAHHYGDLHRNISSHVLNYRLSTLAMTRHRLAYDVASTDLLRRRFSASWSLLADARLQAVANTPELVWHGQRIRIIRATLSCDEESPVWIARVEIATITDFAAIGIGDTITLVLGLETFALVVDGKTLSRTSVAEQRMELTAVSPVALLDAPFAGTIRYYEAGAVSARMAVEFLIGQVDWSLPDWIIPAGRLMLEGATPLTAARNIVAAIGGIVESNPDGSVVCRRRHPVSIPQYVAATVAHSLFDADVMSTQAQIAPMRGYNRVTVANEEGGAGSSADRIEYVADADDAYRGTVRAYLASQRAVVLAHTGHPSTIIASLGAVTRIETETVEFIDGRASTRYPVTAIVNLAWQHTGLGDVTASGQSLTAAISGYSLLRITYTTTSLDWRVALPIDEEVQFVLVDA